MHLQTRMIETWLTTFCHCVLAFNAAIKLLGVATIYGAGKASTSSQNDLWSVERGEVLLIADSWTRYPLNATQQWAPLFPNGGVVHLGPERKPYTVAMMHQLRCLDVIREQLNRPKSARDAESTRHCMNYLRQVVMCRGDVQLDPFQYAHKVNALAPHRVRRCRDWTAVYGRVWENQRESGGRV